MFSPIPYFLSSNSQVANLWTFFVSIFWQFFLAGKYLNFTNDLKAALLNIPGGSASITNGLITLPVFVTVYSTKTQPSIPLCFALAGYSGGTDTSKRGSTSQE